MHSLGADLVQGPDDIFQLVIKYQAVNDLADSMSFDLVQLGLIPEAHSPLGFPRCTAPGPSTRQHLLFLYSSSSTASAYTVFTVSSVSAALQHVYPWQSGTDGSLLF